MITEDLQRFDMDVDDKFFGRMEAATAVGRIQGPCGDSMEFIWK